MLRSENLYKTKVLVQDDVIDSRRFKVRLFESLRCLHHKHIITFFSGY